MDSSNEGSLVYNNDRVASGHLSNSILLDTSVERGYQTNRLSRIKSDRKVNAMAASGKLRFGSESSASDSMDKTMGNLGVSLRVIREVPSEYDE